MISRQSANRAMSLAQVAAVLGLSRFDVRTIENRALRKLAAGLRGEVFETRSDKGRRVMKAYWAKRRAS